MAEEGISGEIVDPRTISPLDTDTIVESAQKTGRCVVNDTPISYVTQSQLSAEVSEGAFWDLDFPVKRIGVENVPIPFSPALEDEDVPDTDDIVDAILELA